MNESIRTIVFLAVASVVAVVAWATRPAPRAINLANTANAFPAFEAGDANSLKIERYDEDEGKLVKFEVAKEGGRWLIPSHDNYPADAEAQLRKVAELFMELKPIGPAQTSDSKEHGFYGVKEPAAEITGDAKEYGRLVSIADKSGDPLLKLIVGKAAAAKSGSDEEPDGGGMQRRFVRQAGRDQVFVVDITLDAIATKFEQWIEQDLLKLNSFDVAKLDLQDYSLVPEQRPEGIVLQLMRRMNTEVKWNGESSQWELEEMTQYRDNEAFQAVLAEDEELNKAKLDGVKTAVDDLKIVDVQRKPGVLAEALKDPAKSLRDQRAMAQLQEYGFFALAGAKPQVFSTNGGLRISMKDGVQYVLNFGDAKSAEKGDASKLNRYLMVTVQVDESMIPKPELVAEEPEPAGPEAPEKKDEKPEGDKPEDKKPEEGASDAPKEGTEDKKGETKDEDAEKKRREAIKKENKRKLEEWQDKKKKAEGRVAELNARFGEWFYVVSDDVYKQVQLGRADIVKDREGAQHDTGIGIDAFRKLQEGGIQGKSKSAPPSPPAGIPGFPGN